MFRCICLGLILLIGCKAEENRAWERPNFEEKLIFSPQSQHVHGPSIVELRNGDLLAAWFQGSGERWADDVKIMGSRLRFGDTIWSEPFLMADKPGFPDINPMLFVDSRQHLWLMWYPVLSNQWESSIPMFRISVDYLKKGSPRWGWQDVLLVKPGSETERGIQEEDLFVNAVEAQLEAYETYLEDSLMQYIEPQYNKLYDSLWNAYKNRVGALAKGENMIRRGKVRKDSTETDAMMGYPLSRRIGWQTKNKPLVMDNRIIVPLYSDLLDASLFAITDDYGDNWEFSNPVLGGAGIQPTLALKKDQSLVAYLRDNGPVPKRMQRTLSVDGGKTWSIAYDTNLPNPGAGFDMTTLGNGDWLIVFNNTEKGRHNLAVGLSKNEGESWKVKNLENDLESVFPTRSHYPAVIQGNDGRIYIVYSYHMQDRDGNPYKSIKYVSFDLEAWFEGD